MPINETPGLVDTRIKKNVEWRGTRYYMHDYYSLSPEYAKHVVETLGVAEYMIEEMHRQRMEGTDE